MEEIEKIRCQRMYPHYECTVECKERGMLLPIYTVIVRLLSVLNVSQCLQWDYTINIQTYTACKEINKYC